MSDRLPADIAALLEVERHAPDPPAATHERLRGRVLASVGLLAAPPVAPPPVPPPAALAPTAAAPLAPAAAVGAAGGALVARALLVAGAALVAGAVVEVSAYLMMRRASDRVAVVAPTPREMEAPLPPVHARSVPSLAPLVDEEDAGARVDGAATRRPALADVARAGSRARPLDDEDAGAELDLLEPARAALAVHDGPAALAAVERHARRFPRGQLVEERESLRVRALAAAGRTDAARRSAASFRRRFPHSVFRPLVDATVHDLP